VYHRATEEESADIYGVFVTLPARLAGVPRGPLYFVGRGSVATLSAGARLLALAVIAAAPARAQAPAPAPPLVFQPALPGSPPLPLALSSAGQQRTAVEPAAGSWDGKQIGTIRIVTKDVFDLERPGEDRGVFRLVNRLHRTTRANVVERQLLFRAGDTFSSRAVQETERLLRANSFFYDVKIRPMEADGGKVDLEVVTRDVWTLEGGVSFHRGGGVNTSEFEVEDINFLGTGKDLTLARRNNVDRSSNLFRYLDPGILGSRALLDLRLSANSDGRSRFFMVDRPFFALDSRWAAGGTVFEDSRIERLYDLGQIVDRFRHQRKFLEVYAGASPGLTDGGTSRFRLGYTYDDNRFAAAARFQPPGQLPGERRLAYPWLSYEYVEDGFVTGRDLDRIQRTEDLNLGRQLLLRLGWSARAFGGDRSRAIFKGVAANGWSPTPRQTLLASTSLSGRWASGGIEDGIASAALRYYARDLGENLFFASLSGDFTHRLDLDSQLRLGGDNGLRGYPLRFQNGTRRAVLTLEQRFFSTREYFHLLHAGAALFFDAGRAWSPEGPSGAGRGLLKDIGAGLRLACSRAAHGSVVHVDVALPLDRSHSIRAVQYLISTSETF
jgi:hypothetical protein